MRAWKIFFILAIVFLAGCGNESANKTDWTNESGSAGGFDGDQFNAVPLSTAR